MGNKFQVSFIEMDIVWLNNIWEAQQFEKQYLYVREVQVGFWQQPNSLEI